MWPGRLERLVAERARRPPGRHDRRARAWRTHAPAAPVSRTRRHGRARRRGPPRGRGPRSPRPRATSCASMIEQLGVAVPAQRHRADAELLGDRGVERVEVVAAERRGGRDRRLTAGAAQDLVEQRVDALGERPAPGSSRGRPTRRAAPSRACRKNWRSPGWPTVPATKRSGWSKSEELAGHADDPIPSAQAPAPPPTTASEEARRAACGFFFGGAGRARRRRRRCRSRAARTAAGRCSARRVTEHGSTAMRWNASRCRPSASAMIALMTSPCETTAYIGVGAVRGGQPRVPVAHGGDRARGHRRPSTRRPRPGKTAALGCACTTFQSGSLARVFSGWLVQSP